MAEIVDVAVVGAGPAGLAAALGLRAAGVKRIVVLEREQAVGGAVRHCNHPTFGLREFGRLMSGPSYARRLQARAACAGVEVRTGQTVLDLRPGGHMVVVASDGAYEIAARRVVLATGARETPRSARLVSGERPLGVLNTGALQSYVYLKGLVPFLRPVIVGTELVGQSAVWTCLRHGVRPVAVVESGAHATVPWPLGLFPRLLGVPTYYGAEITAIAGAPRTEAVEVRTADGVCRRLACDGVLFTGRFTPETALMRAGHLQVDAKGGGVRVDQYQRCSDPAYFATGNLLRSIETAGWCYREGLRTAHWVAEDLASRLAPERVAVPILCGEGVKLTSPQVLSFPLAASRLAPIQVRASDRRRGRLCVRAAGRLVWSKPMMLAPERRILIPPHWIADVAGCAGLTIGVE